MEFKTRDIYRSLITAFKENELITNSNGDDMMEGFSQINFDTYTDVLAALTGLSVDKIHDHLESMSGDEVQ